MASEFLGDRRRALEESFFHECDKELVKRLKADLAEKERKKALSAASGIEDDSILESLLSVDVSSETLACVSLIPLVVVAWADGEVQDQERTAILSAADEFGIHSNDPSYNLLENWLSDKPGGDLFDAWKEYVSALSKSLSESDRENLKTNVLGRARDMAKAAGGVLGMGSICKQEKEVLGELEEVFA